MADDRPGDATQSRSAKRARLVFGLSVALALAAWALGMWGFLEWSAVVRGASPFEKLSDAAYRALQLFQLEFDLPESPGALPWQVAVARLLAPAAVSLAILLGIWLLVRDRIGSFRAGRQKDHIVLCGAGEKGVRLVQRFQRGEYDEVGKRRIVVVDVKPFDSAELVACREAGAIALTGDAREPSTLRRAGVAQARYLVLTCGKDGTNAEIAIQARELVSADRVTALRCFAHVTDPALCRLLREREFEMGVAPNYRLEFFNAYSSAALALLQAHPAFGPADAAAQEPAIGSERATGPSRATASAEAPPPHAMIVGLDPLGRSVVHALARSWARRRATPKPLRLSLCDRDIEGKAASLRLADPALEACVHLRTHELDRALPSFDRRVLNGEDGASPVGIAYVCLHDDGESLAAALSLLRATVSRRMPIVVTMMEDSGLAALLREPRGEFQELVAFSVLDHSCTADLLRGRKEEIARAVHADYLEQARARGRRIGAEPSLVPWNALPESLKRSNRRQADHIFAKLDAIGCALAPYDPTDPKPFEFEPSEVELLARMEHERWVEERREDGWRLGSAKDVERKVTPYLVPWEDLPEEVRQLDRNAVRNLPHLVAMADLSIVRRRPVDRAGPGVEG